MSAVSNRSRNQQFADEVTDGKLDDSTKKQYKRKWDHFEEVETSSIADVFKSIATQMMI